MVTFWIQKPGDTVFLLGDVEHLLHTFPGALALRLSEVQQIGTVAVDDGAEGEAVAPGFGEVLDGDAGILVCRLLRPSQQIVLRRNVRFRLADDYVGDLQDEEQINRRFAKGVKRRSAQFSKHT